MSEFEESSVAAETAAEPAADGEGPGPKQKAADLAIPKNAVKRIMKLDPEVGAVSAEAVIAVAKATEIFLEKFATDSYNIAVDKNRKTVRYEDIADARAADSTLEFLDQLIPRCEDE